MSIGLAKPKYTGGPGKYAQVQFGGYDARPGAGDGTIRAMKNMGTDAWPRLRTRRERYVYDSLVFKYNGYYCWDKHYWVDGTTLHTPQGDIPEALEDSPKVFGHLAGKLLIWPDKKWYDFESHTMGSMEARMEVASLYVKHGELDGIEARSNTLDAEGVDWAASFSVGDAVHVTLGSRDYIGTIREIEGTQLRFDENFFDGVIPESDTESDTESGGDGTTSFPSVSGMLVQNVTVERRVPGADMVCQHGNRLWATEGSTIRSSALGNPLVWERYDGIADDSWELEVTSSGDFTGLCSYGGAVVATKEDRIYRLYGDQPLEFSLYDTPAPGVEAGSAGSMAVAGGVLYYKSRVGVMAYSGSVPACISACFGMELYRSAAAGSDDVKYYISMEDLDGGWHLFVYDTRYSVWHREDELRVHAFGWDGNLYMMCADGQLRAVGDSRNMPEYALETETLESMVEFTDFTEEDPNRKRAGRVQLRLELEAGARLTVQVSFNGGAWEDVRTIEAEGQESHLLPIRPRRCDHYSIRLVGVGHWCLRSLAREYRRSTAYR